LATLDETFIEKNEMALIEEMADSMNTVNELISSAASLTPLDDPNHELTMMKNYLISIAQNMGNLTSCFNQYIVFKTGVLPQSSPMGFKALIDKEE